MCGIIGYAGRSNSASNVLLNGLSKLEYRGYDSAGIALVDTPMKVIKCEGQLYRLKKEVEERIHSEHSVGIGHTRWSTHGSPSRKNAHPHCDCTGEVAVVHNGIIENHSELRSELQGSHDLKSETDTEIVSHLIEDFLATGVTAETAFRKTISRLEGSYALVVVFENRDIILAARNNIPLIVGIGEDDHYIASDLTAFLEYTDRVVYIEDGEIVRLTLDGWKVTGNDGTTHEKLISQGEWDAKDVKKDGYDHFLLKEVHEQPAVIRNCLHGRIDEIDDSGSLYELTDIDVTSVQFVACGTSYHAALAGVKFLHDEDTPAYAALASEYATSTPPIPDNTLVVGITQSGETADTLEALRTAKEHGAQTLALTNSIESTANRICDQSFFIRAGPEISVAATKTFSAQLVALNLLALALGDGGTHVDGVSSALRNLSKQVQTVLDESQAEAIAERFLDSTSYFFVGRGFNYALAYEGALKMKEITYRHSEGFPAGELKHGPLTLITDETPVISVITGDDPVAMKTASNIMEIRSRNAPIIAVTDGQNDLGRQVDATLAIPKSHPRVVPVLANVQLQLLAYHTAVKLGRSIDKPRNLAKSVTVE